MATYYAMEVNPIKTLTSQSSLPLSDFQYWERMGYDTIQFSSVKDFLPNSPLQSIIEIDSPLKLPKNVIPLFIIKNRQDLKKLPLLLPHFSISLWVEIQLTKELNLHDLQKVYQQARDHKVFIRFPIDFSNSPKNYSPHDAHKLIEKLSEDGFQVQTRKDIPAINLSQEWGRYIENGENLIFSNSQNQSFSFSLIIPVYDNKKFVLHVLKSLNKLSPDSPQFEVILCDDGSSDELSKDLSSLYSHFNYAFTHLHIPRNQARQMGDFTYRAGYARNIGAGYAQGDFLVFLDSDILISANFLKVLAEEMIEADLVMCQRHHLKPFFAQTLPSYEDIQESDTMITDFGYWNDFYEKGKEWNQLSQKWKYVCTHSLCMKKETFKKVGGIANNYNIYGYEDVQLGFQIAEQNGSFKLSNNKVYHLSPKKERSEFALEHHKKLQLLSQSSMIFYFNTLDREIYNHTKIFWQRPKSLFRLHGLKMWLKGFIQKYF